MYLSTAKWINCITNKSSIKINKLTEVQVQSINNTSTTNNTDRGCIQLFSHDTSSDGVNNITSFFLMRIGCASSQCTFMRARPIRIGCTSRCSCESAFTSSHLYISLILQKSFLKFLFMLFFRINWYAVLPMHLQFMHHPITGTNKMASNS